MPADYAKLRECRCEVECARTPEGFRQLKYSAWRQHQIREASYQAQQDWIARQKLDREVARELRAEGSSSRARHPQIENTLNTNSQYLTHTRFETPFEPNSPVSDTPLDHFDDDSLPPQVGQGPSEPHTPPLVARSNPPSPPPQQPPLEVEYDSDDSASNYEPRVLGLAHDPPCLRLAYLNALCDHIVHKHPVDDAERILRNCINSLRLANAIPDHIVPLTTLKSVRRHLGLDTSGLLTRRPVCSKCYRPYKHEDITSTDLPATCTRTWPTPCNGTFAKLEYKNGRSTQVPTKVVVYTKIIPSLRRMLMRPSFLSLLSESKALSRNEHDPDVLYDVCHGTAWRTARIGMRRVYRQDGTVSDEYLTPGSELAVQSLGYGLFAALNIDWFGITSKRSSGAVYLAILNIPRHARYLVHNVILACAIPGPKEPSLEDLNFVIDPIVEEFKKLYAGVAMKTYNENLPAEVSPVYLFLLMAVADIPARSKVSGLPPHNHTHRIGCDCSVCHADINNRKAYSPEEFEFYDELDILRLAKYATTSQAARKNTSRDYGIRWSSLNALPGWLPHSSSPFDPMHCLYLGIVSSFWADVIEDGQMLTPAQIKYVEDFLDGLQWPSQIGRLSSPTTSALNRQKADEWRRLVAVLPILLWIAWC